MMLNTNCYINQLNVMLVLVIFKCKYFFYKYIIKNKVQKHNDQTENNMKQECRNIW